MAKPEWAPRAAFLTGQHHDFVAHPLVKGWGAHYTAKGTFKVICGSFIAGDASPKQLDKYLDDLSAPPS